MLAQKELLGHSDVRTTMIYTHVMNKGPMGVRSPLTTLPGSDQMAKPVDMIAKATP